MNDKTIIRAWEEEPDRVPNPGYVYIVGIEGHKVYKIGCSVDVERRITTLQRGRSGKLICVAAIWSEQYQQLEFQMQRQFSERHLSGEWFALTDEDVEWIKAMKS